jgi:tol-pal system protein YbgF
VFKLTYIPLKKYLWIPVVTLSVLPVIAVQAASPYEASRVQVVEEAEIKHQRRWQQQMSGNPIIVSESQYQENSEFADVVPAVDSQPEPQAVPSFQNPSILVEPTTAPVYTPSSAGSSNTTALSQDIQVQEEIMYLRGRVEELEFKLEQMVQDQRARYIDLDMRINAIAGSATGSTAGEPISSTPSSSQFAAPSDANQDKLAYEKAQKLLSQKAFPEAIQELEDLLRRSPNGVYAPYCEYWLGELWVAAKPQDLQKSKTHFVKLLKQYPKHSKVPDAMYKLAKVFYLQGETAKAKATLDALIEKHPSTQAASLAKTLKSTL